MKVQMRITLLILVLLIFSVPACRSPETEETTVYEYISPEALEDGLEVGHLSEAGMDLAGIEDLVDAVLNGPYLGVHSVLILKNGRLVLEEYFRPCCRTGNLCRSISPWGLRDPFGRSFS